MASREHGAQKPPNQGVSNFIMRVLRGQDITLNGDGSQSRSFCFGDLIDAMILMMDSPDEVTGPINIGNLAGISPLRRRALPAHRIAAHSATSNYGI